MDPIFLYTDEVEGAYRITIGRSGDYIKTPMGNDYFIYYIFNHNITNV